MVKSFNIEDKIFKIVADQAANVKKAFRDEISKEKPVEKDCLDFIETLASEMLFKQSKQDLIEKKQELLVDQLEKAYIYIYFFLCYNNYKFIYLYNTRK